MRGLIDNAASQEYQIALLWKVLEELSVAQSKPECIPADAAKQENFEAARINQLLD
jgi:serine O-acetyltransferase